MCRLTCCTILVIFFTLGCSGCAVSKKAEKKPALAEIVENPIPPEKAEGLLGEVGENWLYGVGLGDTAITVGTICAFPPYALWVVGNAALSVSGYEPLRFSDALPEKERDTWKEAYASVASGPGRLSAAIAGREFRSEGVAKDRLEKYLKEPAVESSGGVR